MMMLMFGACTDDETPHPGPVPRPSRAARRSAADGVSAHDEAAWSTLPRSRACSPTTTAAVGRQQQQQGRQRLQPCVISCTHGQAALASLMVRRTWQSRNNQGGHVTITLLLATRWDRCCLFLSCGQCSLRRHRGPRPTAMRSSRAPRRASTRAMSFPPRCPRACVRLASHPPHRRHRHRHCSPLRPRVTDAARASFFQRQRRRARRRRLFRCSRASLWPTAAP